MQPASSTHHHVPHIWQQPASYILLPGSLPHQSCSSSTKGTGEVSLCSGTHVRHGPFATVMHPHNNTGSSHAPQVFFLEPIHRLGEFANHSSIGQAFSQWADVHTVLCNRDDKRWYWKVLQFCKGQKLEFNAPSHLQQTHCNGEP